jgi:hypothetical protein
VQPSMHKDASMVTGTSALFSTRGMGEIYFSDQKTGMPAGVAAGCVSLAGHVETTVR